MATGLKIMSDSIYVHLIDWDEFHRRFALMDLTRAEPGVFRAVFGEPSKSAAMSAESFALLDLHRLLKTVCCPPALPVKGRRARLAQEQRLADDACARWLANFEFSFARLMPFWFNPPSYSYRDSPLDFSPLEQNFVIQTVSPATVRAIAQRFPTLEIYYFPQYQQITSGPRGEDYHTALHFHLAQWRIIVSRALKENKGLCSYVL